VSGRGDPLSTVPPRTTGGPERAGRPGTPCAGTVRELFFRPHGSGRWDRAPRRGPQHPFAPVPGVFEAHPGGGGAGSGRPRPRPAPCVRNVCRGRRTARRCPGRRVGREGRTIGPTPGRPRHGGW